MTVPGNDPGQIDSIVDAEVIGVNNAQVSSAERFLRLQTSNIRNRLNRLRTGGAAGAGRDSFTFSASNTSSYGRNNTNPSRSATATVTSDSAYASPFDCVVPRTWSLWGESMISFGTDRKGVNDNDHLTFGGTIGIDRFFGECFAAGVALGYAHDKTDVGNRGSESKGNAYTAALYGSYSHPTGFYLDGSAGYSRLDLDSTRYTANGFARGDRDGNQYFAALETGYDMRRGGLLISPFARADASTTRLDGYTERGGGAAALKYKSTDINLFSLTAGVRGEYAIAMCWGDLVPSAGIEYTHNFRETASQRLGFVSEGSTPYLLRSKALANNQFGANAGLDANFSNGWSVGGEYRGTYAKKRYDHAFYLSIAKSW